MRPVIIRSRLGEFQGEANNGIAIFDRTDSKSGKLVRHFILLDYGVKLMYEPWGWVNEWYADIVAFFGLILLAGQIPRSSAASTSSHVEDLHVSKAAGIWAPYIHSMQNQHTPQFTAGLLIIS